MIDCRRNGYLSFPNGPRNGVFTNDVGKAKFTINQLPDYEVAEDELLMMTIRSHDQFNTTVYGLDDRYRGVFGGREIVFMNEEDIKTHGVEEGDAISLYNRFNNVLRQVDGLQVVAYDIPKGCVATYFPECNPLIPLDYQARKSNTPASKSVRVKVKR